MNAYWNIAEVFGFGFVCGFLAALIVIVMMIGKRN